jgi:hypothetical protein
VYVGSTNQQKNPEYCSVFWQKISVFCKFQQIFQILLLSKIYRKKLQKSCQQSAPKNLCRKYFCFTGKICLYEISCVHRKQDIFLADGNN